MRRRAVVAAALVFLAVAGCGSRDRPPSTGAAGELVGVFRLTGGVCDEAGVVSGSWLRIVRPGGTPSNGPFVANTYSPCADQTITPLGAGDEGGLRTGRYQPDPVPAFDPAGNANARAVVTPTTFDGVNLSLATNPLDPQQKLEVGPPRLAAVGRVLRGDLRAISMAWNGEHFNQGGPKPDGSRPAGTSPPLGAYDASTRAFTIEWTSAIVGGPLSNCYGVWHFEGRFEPS